MESYFQKYLSDVEWLLQEDTFDVNLQPLYESLFTLGNGYVGSRGIYEETPHKSRPGTFFAGYFDEVAATVAELINAPNPFAFSLYHSKFEKVDIVAMGFESHNRILDLRKGLLHRHTVFKNSNNQLFDFQSLRFISLANLNVAVMQMIITPLTKEAYFTVDCSIDTTIKNRGIILEQDKRDYDIVNVEKLGDFYFLTVESLDHQKEIAYGQCLLLGVKGQTNPIANNTFEIFLDKDESAVITKVITLFTAKNDFNRLQLRHKAIVSLGNAVQKGFDELINEHIAAFDCKWQVADISVVGDVDSQSAIRLSIYHLLIAAHSSLRDTSIGAKLLTGEGYKGHIFWETEILLLPFYLSLEPLLARRLLEYRFNRLEAAKKIATSRGFAGALFPWESAETGCDETPPWAQDLDKTIKIVHTGRQSVHINLAIFYGIYLYHHSTQDLSFMLEMGLTMMIEMARFWVSRVSHSRKINRYRIKHVMGPDEFHEDVNDNAYTNKLVAWSLEQTLNFLDSLKKSHPKEVNEILKKMKFNEKERMKIYKISQNMVIPTLNDIILQFDNFLKLKQVRLPALDVFGLPSLPADFLVVDLYKTQFVKQADVILLLLLLPMHFDKKIAEANFHFYDNRTLHKSSWSAPIYSAVAAQLSFAERAYHYFLITLNTDRKNIFHNIENGMHGPAVAGTWLVVVSGFCGVRASQDKLVITPNLPALWRSVAIKFHYLEFICSLTVSKSEIKIIFEKIDSWLLEQPGRRPTPFIAIEVNRNVMQITPGREYVIGYESGGSCFS